VLTIDRMLVKKYSSGALFDTHLMLCKRLKNIQNEGVTLQQYCRGVGRRKINDKSAHYRDDSPGRRR
jgi:hypothetical protein